MARKTMNIEILKVFYEEAVNKCVEYSKDKPYPLAWTFEHYFAQAVAEHCAKMVETSYSAEQAAYEIRMEFNNVLR
jgi:hypothetical protein